MASLTAAEVTARVAGKVPMRGEDLSGLDLSNRQLSGGDFSLANLTGSDLTGALLKGAKLDEAFMEQTKLGNADFEDASLIGANLGGARGANTNFRNAKLDRSNLEFGLTKPNFTGAKYDDAYLPGWRAYGVAKPANFPTVKPQFPSKLSPGFASPSSGVRMPATSRY